MAEDRPKKLAFIGATGYEYSSPEARIECFPWDRLGKASTAVLIMTELRLRSCIERTSYRRPACGVEHLPWWAHIVGPGSVRSGVAPGSEATLESQKLGFLEST